MNLLRLCLCVATFLHLSTAPLAPCSTERIVICNKSQPKQKKQKRHFVITKTWRNDFKTYLQTKHEMQEMFYRFSNGKTVKNKTSRSRTVLDRQTEPVDNLIGKLFLTPIWWYCSAVTNLSQSFTDEAEDFAFRNSLLFQQVNSRSNGEMEKWRNERIKSFMSPTFVRRGIWHGIDSGLRSKQGESTTRKRIVPQDRCV